jgi:hypothetical protein
MVDKSDTRSAAELRVCTECGQQYSIEELLSSSPSYFNAPHNYDRGCDKYCLACWLGVGPKDVERMEKP